MVLTLMFGTKNLASAWPLRQRCIPAQLGPEPRTWGAITLLMNAAAGAPEWP